MRILLHTEILTIWIYIITQRTDSAPNLYAVMMQLSHPEIIQLYDLITADDVRIMDYKDEHSHVLMLFPELLKTATVSRARRSRENQYPRVELYPGMFKTEIIDHPPDTLSKDLQKIYRLKQKYERERKQ